MSQTELRIDPIDGNAYTRESFLSVYDNGEDMWTRAEIFTINTASPPRIRIGNAASVSPSESLVTPETTPVPEFQLASDDFPETIVSSRPSTASPAWPCPRETALEDFVPARETALSPLVEDFVPLTERALQKDIYIYTTDAFTTNADFENMPHDLWEGREDFIQPVLNGEENIDWEQMIQDWSVERWREFGIKYFYGYVQQSSIIMEHLGDSPSIENDEVVGDWGGSD